MIYFYRLLALPLMLITSPYFIGRKLRREGILVDWKQRFGFLPNLPNKNQTHLNNTKSKKRIWIQAVSVGEILAIETLIDQLMSTENIDVILTTTTSTGYKTAKERYSKKIKLVALFPIDFWIFSKIAWSRIDPDCIILAESELWPEHLTQANKNNTPVFMINARLSNLSFKRLKAFKPFAHFLFSKVKTIYSATQIDYDRFLALGIKADSAIGNIKLDVPFPPPLSTEEKFEHQNLLFSNTKKSEGKKFILIGASTWPGEEALLLSAQKICIQSGIDCRLIIVPRHVERKASIIKLLKEQNLKWALASGAKEDSMNQNDISIFLSDKTGNLSKLVRLADLAFIGKSMPPNKGGQTPIEAVAQGVPIITGPNTSNFDSIIHELKNASAGIQIQNSNLLSQKVLELAQDTKKRSNLAQSGIDWHKSNKGISNLISEAIIASLKD